MKALSKATCNNNLVQLGIVTRGTGNLKVDAAHTSQVNICSGACCICSVHCQRSLQLGIIKAIQIPDH